MSALRYIIHTLLSRWKILVVDQQRQVYKIYFAESARIMRMYTGMTQG